MPNASPREPLMMSEHSQLVFEEESNVKEEGSGNSCRERCPRVLLFFIFVYLAMLGLFLTLAVVMRKQSARTHIIVIMADDLGWGDVQWTDPDMRTPALSALLDSGVLLNNSYVHPLDSPSRASFFTGMYPFRMGLQHERMKPHTPTFVPENFTFFPQRLQDLGYKTHLVGKWHLGFCDWKYAPAARGFNSFAGFYTDGLDYYTHKDSQGHYDFRMGEMVDYHAEGTHSTRVLTDRATSIIFNHDITVPLFLLISFQAVHSPPQVPQKYVNETCGHITDTSRQTLCAMAAMMDEGISNVTSMLRDKGMLRDAVIIVTSDNGGSKELGSSNGPFRGYHGQLYEGGTHVVTLVSSESHISVPGSTYSGLFHQVDWHPTILSIAGSELVKDLDGFNQWHAIRTGSTSPRSELVYNIDDTYNNAAIRIDSFKLMEGSPNYTHFAHVHTDAHELYDLGSDPGESVNLASAMPKKVDYMKSRLQKLRQTLVPAVDKTTDPKSDPALWNNVWSPGWC